MLKYFQQSKNFHDNTICSMSLSLIKRYLFILPISKDKDTILIFFYL